MLQLFGSRDAKGSRRENQPRWAQRLLLEWPSQSRKTWARWHTFAHFLSVAADARRLRSDCGVRWKCLIRASLRRLLSALRGEFVNSVAFPRRN